MLLVFAPLDAETTRAGTDIVSGSRRGDVLKAELQLGFGVCPLLGRLGLIQL